MPLTLDQYAAWLDTRGLPWPAPPAVEPAKARAHLAPLHGLKAVLWNVYGTLLAIPFGELVFEHPTIAELAHHIANRPGGAGNASGS